MDINIQSILFNQFVLLFFVIGIGNLFGKIKIGNFSFGLTGSLFIGIIVGGLLTIYASGIEGSDRASAIIQGQIVNGNLTSMGLMIFITATGLMASKSVGFALKNYGVQFLVLAILIPFVGFASTLAAGKLSSVNIDQVNGAYVGALTSSAGLGSAIDSSNQNSRQMALNFEDLDPQDQQNVLDTLNRVLERNASLEGTDFEPRTLENTQSLTEEEIALYLNEREAGIGAGYSIAYPFGVLAIILGVNIIPALARIDVEDEKKRYFAEKAELTGQAEKTQEADSPDQSVYFDFAAFSITVFLGYILGSIGINLGPLGVFRLGNVGGGVIMGLILGSIGKVGPINFTMNGQFLNSFRNYFLSLFLGGIGLNYGYVIFNALAGSGIQIVIIAIIVASLSILAGFLVGRYIFKMNWVMLSGAITGGMTSAPGMGAAVEAVGHEDASIGYAATQPVATLFMVLFSLLLYYF